MESDPLLALAEDARTFGNCHKRTPRSAPSSGEVLATMAQHFKTALERARQQIHLSNQQNRVLVNEAKTKDRLIHAEQLTSNRLLEVMFSLDLSGLIWRFQGQKEPFAEPGWITRANPGAGSQSTVPRKRPWKERNKENEELEWISSHPNPYQAKNESTKRIRERRRRSSTTAEDDHQEKVDEGIVWSD